MFDISVGLVAVAVAAIAVYLFIRASSESSSGERKEPSKFIEEEASPSLYRITPGERDRVQLPKTERHLKRSDLDRARSNIRTLTLQSELFSMMLKRLLGVFDFRISLIQWICEQDDGCPSLCHVASANDMADARRRYNRDLS